MNLILKDCRVDEKCSYIEDNRQNTHYQIIDKCSTTHCHDLVVRGWRRFGKMFFRPMCDGCSSCESVKVNVDEFKFTKSKRRIIKKNSHIRVVVQKPVMSKHHLALFDKYHKFKGHQRDWDYKKTTSQNYFYSFVDGANEFGYEVLYLDGDKLIGVDLIDILPTGISSIYFYYDTDYLHLSLGHYSLYQQIKIAKRYRLKWIYLGYYVKDCQSLEYKSSYQPQEVLQGRPEIDEKDEWKLKV
ncbi:MAG: arginyltransferase [Campylobacterota bacterium]|nr:arginyltransferase [Campylobacterota bacterium]